MSRKDITSIQMLIEEVFKDYSSWGEKSIPWFRGEPRDTLTPLLPNLFRKRHNELKLLQHFRMKAPSLGLPFIPPRDHVDQWLFLAQHVRLPTRLLDWTEGLLIALHFALYSYEMGAVVWMLNPDELNRKSMGNFENGDYALTWFSHTRRPMMSYDLYRIREMIKSQGQYNLEDELQDNVGNMNINNAWTHKGMETPYPWALHPTNIHPRMSSQISRFTIHGEKKISMCEMGLGDKILRKYVVADDAIPFIKDELRIMGITHSTLFPELDGLSDELAEIY